MLGRLVVLALVTIVAQGCLSMTGQGPPQARPGAPEPTSATCTTSKLIPVSDQVAGALFGVLGLLAATGAIEVDELSDDERKVFGIAYAAWECPTS